MLNCVNLSNRVGDWKSILHHHCISMLHLDTHCIHHHCISLLHLDTREPETADCISAAIKINMKQQQTTKPLPTQLNHLTKRFPSFSYLFTTLINTFHKMAPVKTWKRNVIVHFREGQFVLLCKEIRYSKQQNWVISALVHCLPVCEISPPCLGSKPSTRLSSLDRPFHKPRQTIPVTTDYAYLYTHIYIYRYVLAHLSFVLENDWCSIVYDLSIIISSPVPQSVTPQSSYDATCMSAACNVQVTASEISPSLRFLLHFSSWIQLLTLNYKNLLITLSSQMFKWLLV